MGREVCRRGCLRGIPRACVGGRGGVAICSVLGSVKLCVEDAHIQEIHGRVFGRLCLAVSHGPKKQKTKQIHKKEEEEGRRRRRNALCLQKK